MQLRYNFRLAPDATQREALARASGCARTVLNDGLRARQEARAEGLPYLSDGDLSKSGSSPGPRSRRSGCGRWSRRLPADPSSVTVVKDAAGRYFASFVAQATDEPLPPLDSEVGIDLGLTHFAVLSDGTKVASPKFLRQAARKLKRVQQALSRKTKGSNRRRKAVAKVTKAHARVTDTRRDWQHKLSTSIIRDNQAVYVEDLCVVGLGRTRLAKSVHDAGWASFTGMLEYKAARYGRTFARVDRFFPSTRLCSDCGRVNDKLALEVRSWNCPCGSTHDRDVNAAKNIKAAGQADFHDRGAWVGPAAMPAPRGEAVTHPDAACSTRGVEGFFVP